MQIPGKLDYILHFASLARPIDYFKMPIQTLKVGAHGAHNLLGLAKDPTSQEQGIYWVGNLRLPVPRECVEPTSILRPFPKKHCIKRSAGNLTDSHFVHFH